MSLLAKIIHRSYFVLYALVTIVYLGDLFLHETEIFMYYKILTLFSPTFIPHYVANIASAIVNVICLIPFFLIAFNYRWSAPWIWKWMLVVRLALDLFGRTFEYQYIKSIYYSGPTTFTIVIMSFIILHLPSYIAQIQYAFKKDYGKNL